MCGDTEIKVQNLQDKLKMLNSVDPATEHSYLQAEFRVRKCMEIATQHILNAARG